MTCSDCAAAGRTQCDAAASGAEEETTGCARAVRETFAKFSQCPEKAPTRGRLKLGLGRLSTMIRSKPPDCGTVELSDAAAGSSEGEDANHRMQSSVQPSPWPWFYFMIIANFLRSASSEARVNWLNVCQIIAWTRAGRGRWPRS